MPAATQDELVSILVPKRFYSTVIQAVAAALAAEGDGPSQSSAQGEPPWTASEIRRLRKEPLAKAVRALMDITCASPGRRVTFQEVYEHAGRTYGQARADLAGFTRLIRGSFQREKWPVAVAQGPEKGLIYHAEPSVAAAWNEATD